MLMLLKRFAAYVIDYIIVYVGSKIVGAIMWILLGVLFLTSGDSLISIGDSFFDSLSSISLNFGESRLIIFFVSLIMLPLSIIFTFFPYWLYFSILESSKSQATIGKKIFKLKVTDLNGDQIHFKTASIRYFTRPEILTAFIVGVFVLVVANIFMLFETGSTIEQIQLYDRYSWFFDRVNEDNFNLFYFSAILLIVGLNYYVYKNSEIKQSLHELLSRTLVREIGAASGSNSQRTEQRLYVDDSFKAQPAEDSSSKGNLSWFGGNYSGQIKEGVPNGEGSLVLPDNNSYQGQWVMGKPDGYGRLISNTGVTYAGCFKMGKRDGYGVYKKPDGTIYGGKWQSGKLVERAIEYEGYLYEVFIKNNLSIDALAFSLNVTIEKTLHDIQEMISKNVLEGAVIDRKSKRIIFKQQQEALPGNLQANKQVSFINEQNINQQTGSGCRSCRRPLRTGAKFCTYCGTARFDS